MRVSLRAIERNAPQDRAKTLELNLRDGQGFTIGRTEGDLVLPYDGLSRKHLRLVVQSRALVAEDLNSTNGTYFQGKRIKTIPLKEADVLRMGRHTLVVDRIVPDGREKGLEVVKTQPRREPEPKARAAAPVGTSDFPFLRGNLPDPTLLWAFFRKAVGGWQTFWDTLSFGVSAERSLLVLGATGFVSGLSWAVFGLLRMPMSSVISILPMSLALSTGVAITGGLMMAGIHHLARSFLRASGDFRSYLCFAAYAMVLCLPLGIVQSVLGYGIGTLALFVYYAYVTWGFARVFRASLARVVVLWMGLTLVLSVGAVGLFFRMFFP